MPNSLDPGGQHAQQEASDKFTSTKTLRACAPVVVGSDGKDNFDGRDDFDALIANGGAVGVARSDALCSIPQWRFQSRTKTQCCQSSALVKTPSLRRWQVAPGKLQRFKQLAASRVSVLQPQLEQAADQLAQAQSDLLLL